MRRWVIIIAPCWALLAVAVAATVTAAGILAVAAAAAALLIAAVAAAFAFYWMPQAIWRELAGPAGSQRVAAGAVGAWIGVVVGFILWIA